MKQMLFPLVQLTFVVFLALANDYEPNPTFLDTSHMTQIGDQNSRVSLIVSFDPDTNCGQRFLNELEGIYEEFIQKGFVCYYEEKKEGLPITIFINGQNKTQEVLESSLGLSLSREIFKEL